MTETIAATVERFIAHKRAHGRRYHSEARELALLVRFAAGHQVSGLGELTPALLEDFLASRPRPHPRSFNHLLGVVRCLLDWAVTWGLLEASPLQARRHRVTEQHIPFLFDPVQARRLLDAAAALPDGPRAPSRGPTYHAIFALCYALGLRASEACGLRLGDADAGRSLLVVRGGKFGKSRLVPHGPRVAALVSGQTARRAHAGAADAHAPLFTFDGRRPVHPGTASQAFHRLVAALDLPVPDGVSPPRLHDLRHSFAVGCLLGWYREGIDPSTRLCQLSTFMGHVEPRSTSAYLTMTPQLLAEASRRFEAFAAPAWTQAAR
jgi:integrase